MQLSNKQYGLIILALALLSGIGAYFARTYKLDLTTEKSAHQIDSQKLITLEASLKVKSAQLERALTKRTTSTPVLLGGKIAYIKTSDMSDLMVSKTAETDAYIIALETEKVSLLETIEKLTKKESSKSGVKRFGVIGHYDLSKWQAGLGYRQDLGIVDISLFGLVGVPALNQYGLACSVGF